MASYIIETGRGYPNAVTQETYTNSYDRPSSGDYRGHDYHSGPGTNYNITFNDFGPGTMVMGKDIVYYIGDEEQTCVGANCDGYRRAVYRWYRGKYTDHKYTDTKYFDYSYDFPGESKSNREKVGKGYNREPRDGRAVFWLSKTDIVGKTTPLVAYYNNDINDTLLSTSPTTVTPTFDQSGNLVVGGTGTGTIEFRFSWNDNPSTAGVALGTYAISSLGISFTQTSGVQTGSLPSQTATVTAGQTYNCTITNGNAAGFDVMNGDQTLCFKDGHGNDCNATLSIGYPGDYERVSTIGHIWTSLANAQAYAVSGETPVPLYEYLWNTNTTRRDSFYTISPQEEVNLQTGVAGVPDCKDPRDQSYTYVGIVGYVFALDRSTAAKKLMRDIAAIGPTGECNVDRSNWYQWNNEWTLLKYLREQNGVPAVQGWGNPANVAGVNTTDALFEWFYGRNGAVKAALPRYLSFETSYDSQFVYYLYDTSYPWNGPIFGINFSLSDAACCPNSTDAEGCPSCVPVPIEYSRFYEVREDSWETLKTKLVLSDMASENINESYNIFDTESRRILFRYTTTTGSFYIGEQINGWDITQLRYFGDELKVGYMELSGEGSAFSYNQAFTSTDNGAIVVLAGFGIADKAGFAGVYEFPKKIQYYQVEIDPEQLIATRTLDKAEIVANINNKGQVASIDIINGGFGYMKPKIDIEQPAVLTELGANDLSRKTLHGLGGWSGQSLEQPEDPVYNPRGDKNNFMMKDIKEKQSAIANEKNEETYQERERLMPYSENSDVQIAGTDQSLSVENKKLRRQTGEGKGKTEFRKAKLQITKLDDNGTIEEILITDRGSGYDFDPDNKPQVYIVDVETETYKIRGPNTQPQVEDYKTAIRHPKGLKQELKKGTSANDSEMDVMDIGVIGGLNTLMNGFTAQYPVGYLRMNDVDKEEETALCNNLPAGCINIEFPKIIEDALFTVDDVQGMIKSSDEFAEFMDNQYPTLLAASRDGDGKAENIGGLYGFNGGSPCVKIGQPKFYSATRFYDIPCPYIKTNEDGDNRAFGYMVHKYCASKSDNASFRVSMVTEGHTTGAQGQEFMNFMRNLPEPLLTETRKTPPGGSSDQKCWPCKRGSIEGRCYRDSGNVNDIIFVPVGSDENTYDWNRQGFSEYEQFKVWLGDNLTNHSPGTSYTWIAHEEDPESGQELDVRQWSYTDITVAMPVNGVPPNECWDTYLRTAQNAIGPLDAFCGYNPSDPPPGTDKTATGGYWDVGYIATPPCAGHLALDFVSDAAIAVNPRLCSEFEIILGPTNGTMDVKNYNTGATIVFGDTVRNVGNPYFTECDLVFGQMTSIVNPPQLLKGKERIAKVSWDPTDPDRPEYDPNFKIPETNLEHAE